MGPSRSPRPAFLAKRARRASAGKEGASREAEVISEKVVKVSEMLGTKVTDKSSVSELVLAMRGLGEETFQKVKSFLEEELMAHADTQHRAQRTAISNIVCAVYSLWCEAHGPAGVCDIRSYVIHRARDVEKKIRGNCLDLALNYLPREDLAFRREVLGTMFQMAKNKNKKVRDATIAKMDSQKKNLARLIREEDAALAERTLLSVLDFSLEEVEKNPAAVKRLLSIVRYFHECKIITPDAVLKMLRSRNMHWMWSPRGGQSEAFVVKSLSRILRSRLSRSEFVCGLLDTRSSSSLQGDELFSESLMGVVACSIRSYKGVFAKFSQVIGKAAREADRLDAASEAVVHRIVCVVHSLVESKYLEEQGAYLGYADSLFERLIGEKGGGPNASLLLLSEIFLKYLDCGVLGLDVLLDKFERIFGRLGASDLEEFAPVLEKLSEHEDERVSSFMGSIMLRSMHDHAKIRALAARLNVLAYLRKEELDLVINRDNVTNFYVLLWYVYSAAPKRLPCAGACLELDIEAVCVLEIDDGCIGDAVEFAALFGKLEASPAFSSALSGVHSKLSHEIGAYMRKTLEAVRSSREELVRKFGVLEDLFTQMLSAQANARPAPALEIVRENLPEVTSLLLYFINSEPLFRGLVSVVRRFGASRAFSGSVDRDLENLKRYGILKKASARRLARVRGLVKDRGPSREPSKRHSPIKPLAAEAHGDISSLGSAPHMHTDLDTIEANVFHEFDLTTDSVDNR